MPPFLLTGCSRMMFWRWLSKTYKSMSLIGVLLVPVRAHTSTPRNISSGTNPTTRKIVVNLVFRLLRLSNLGGSFRAEAEARIVVEVALAPHITPSLPVVVSHINDNQCLWSPLVQLKSKSGDLNLVSATNKVTFQKTVNLHVVLPAVSVKGPLQKKNVRPSHAKIEIKSVNSALPVNQCLFAPNVINVPCVVKDPPVGGRLQLFWQVWLSLGSNPRVVSILREGYQLPFKERPPLARFPVIVSGSSAPLRNKKLNEALQSLGQKQAIEKVLVQSSLGFYNRLFLVPKPNKKWRPILDLSQLNLYLAPTTFKMETPETIRLSLQQGEWVTSLDFSDAYFHIPINHRSQKYLRFHLQGQTFQFTALPFGRSLGWVVNMDKSELVPQQTFDFVGYHFDLSQGLVKPTQERWRSLSQKLNLLLGLECCSVRQLMSLIGLLTATEKQVVSGRLHMRPIQWHLKKVIPIPSSLHVHLRWWLDPAKVLSGQPLHPLQHALQLFTDASNEGWGAHLGDYMAKGVWLESEGALHINLLELKAVLLALKRFKRLCCNQIVLVCTDNTTVVSYINKEGGMKSGSLCALLCRLMLWCNQRQIVLRARHIPGHLNVIADKLSRLNQVIQTEWSLLPEVFAQICRRWHRPSVDLFATRFNHKLPRFQTDQRGKWMP